MSLKWACHLRESTIVPKIAVIGKAVVDITEFTLLHVLLDGVEFFSNGNLRIDREYVVQTTLCTYRIAGNFGEVFNIW